MNRRNFIATSSLAAMSLTTMGYTVKREDGTITGDCETTKDILGPFFRENSPTRSDLTFKGLSGNRIQVAGTVYQPDCKTPLENAKIEIWQCDTEGNYDNISSKFTLRGQQKSDEKGEYNFQTILPGKYLNGRLYRPAHIHFRVTSKDHKELISQIYFQGDPHITDDPWASDKDAVARILPIIPESVKSDLTVQFDIYLKAV